MRVIDACLILGMLAGLIVSIAAFSSRSPEPVKPQEERTYKIDVNLHLPPPPGYPSNREPMPMPNSKGIVG
jgi:hypothetical protein